MEGFQTKYAGLEGFTLRSPDAPATGLTVAELINRQPDAAEAAGCAVVGAAVNATLGDPEALRQFQQPPEASAA